MASTRDRVGDEEGEKENIREIVREEINRSRGGSENIYARTQRLIHSAAENVVSLNNGNNNTSSITYATNESANNNSSIRTPSTRSIRTPSTMPSFHSIPNDTTKTPKSVVGHPYRYNSPYGSRGKGKGKSPRNINNNDKIKTVEVILLDEDLEKRDKYKFTDDMIVSSFFLDILPQQKERDIRNSIKTLVEKQYPLVSPNVFEFLKCSRATVSYPLVPDNFEWDYQHIKTLIGQGKLYLRLIVPSYTLLLNQIDDGDECDTSDIYSYALVPAVTNEVCLWERIFCYFSYILLKTIIVRGL